MTKRIIARHDPALGARVVTCTELRYDDEADSALDRPAHVRAASSLARINDQLIIIQDDANFVALYDAATESVKHLTLPAGADGRRQFDDLRGNKKYKFDFEGCTIVPDVEGALLVAFGSGSKRPRESVLVVSGWERGELNARVHDAPALYEYLRRAHDFAGSDMNIEGVLYVNGTMRLFARGNGAARDERLPLDATCDLDWQSLYAHLHDPQTASPPEPTRIVQYDLGALDGVQLNFTDAALVRDDLILFAAAAEASPDAEQDGAITGSALGVMNGDNLRWTPLTDADGALLRGKVEGLTLAGNVQDGVYVVLDNDDPRAPSALYQVRLTGFPAW